MASIRKFASTNALKQLDLRYLIFVSTNISYLVLVYYVPGEILGKFSEKLLEA